MGPRPSFAFILVVCCIAAAVSAQNDISEDINKLSRANAFFTEKIYKQLSKNSGNFVISSLSISVALGMLNAGANGYTLQEINSTLGLSFAQLNEQELLQGYHNLVESMIESRDGYQFSLANALFLQNSSIPMYPEYVSNLVDSFHARGATVDFGNKYETLRKINEWVSKETRNQIPSILENVSPLDVMTLVNAVYFKGQWVMKFDKERTADIDFFTESGTRKTTKMMIRVVSAKYNADHPVGASILELPYEENLFSMIFILPSTGETLRSVEDRITPQFLLSLSDDLILQNVSAGIPKIKLESAFNLVDHLKAIGIERVFSDKADFSRLSPQRLKVTQAVHKATVEINEEGSEASAATASVTTSRAAPHRPYFWANRPYMFILRHNPTNTVCFMGKVVEM